MHYNQRVGRFGEKLAQGYLARHGYKIIDTNIKISYKEIDIVALKDKRLVFVEVKTRTSDKFGVACEAVFAHKTKNLKQAIGIYLGQVEKDVKYDDIRLDLVAVDINKVNKTAKIKHYKDIA
jgi:putative endonuclease